MRWTIAVFAALALLFAGAMCGPVGMRTSSSARVETQPVGFQIANATGGSDIPASAAGAVPKNSEIDGGSSPNGMESTENLNPDEKEGSGPWKSTAGGSLNSTVEGQQADACPACESMFGKLDGKKQDVKLQLRGVSRPRAALSGIESDKWQIAEYTAELSFGVCCVELLYASRVPDSCTQNQARTLVLFSLWNLPTNFDGCLRALPVFLLCVHYIRSPNPVPVLCTSGP